MFDFEVEVFNHIHYNHCSLITKSRQMGLSTLYIMYMFWFIKYDYSYKKDIIYVTNNLRDTLSKFQSINWLIHKEIIANNHWGPQIEPLTNGIMYNGKRILIKESKTFLDKHKICSQDFKDVELMIFDEVDFSKCHSIEHGLHYIFREIPRVSFGLTPRYEYDLTPNYDNYNNNISTLYLDRIAICVHNYNLHYSKSPLWTYEMLDEHLRYYGDYQWNLVMECKFKKNRDEPITITPYKTKWDVAIEKELNLLLNENIHE